MNFEEVSARELTDSDLRKLLGRDIPITLYNDLEGKSLGQIVDHSGRGIVLFVQKENSTMVEGHWLAVCRMDDGVLIFDPYGGRQDPWFLNRTFVTERALDALDQEAPLLSSMVKASGLRPLFTGKRLQAMKEGIETCGRHCVVRLWNRHLSSAAYEKWLERQDDNPDLTVCKQTYAKLGY